MFLTAAGNKKKFFLRIVFFLLSLPFFAISFNLYASKAIKARFRNREKIKYHISYNGIPSGSIIWTYLGQEVIDGQKVDILSVESDTKILKLLNLVSSEKVYLDSKTHLPVKVRRDIKLFGKKEIIEENYNQEKGKVTINREKGNKTIKKEVYKQDAPIHNILELLYFFPKNIDLSEGKGKWMLFNLPNQQVKIKFHSKRKVSIQGEKREAYFLVGKGAKRFNLWLSQKNRLPLRVDFISLLGKVIIRRID